MNNKNESDNDFIYKLYKLKNNLKYEKSPNTFNIVTIKLKIIIIIYILQSFLISLIWSIINQTFYPWFIFTTSLLQIGWFWNNIRSTWKLNRLNNSLNSNGDDNEHLLDDNIPSLNIDNNGLNNSL